ncbi:MAG: DUF1018 domain-containing protein [Ruminococcus sp.]|nr:DUF1018 domain-containing protein [Ruminococcus sp.]
MADNAQIRLIYALASKLGINQNSREDNLHQLVHTLTGKESIKELSYSEAAAVQAELMRQSKDIKNEKSKKPIDVPPGKMSESQQKKAWSLIYRLQEVSPSSASASERMKGAVRKILGMEINMNNPAPFRMVTAADGIKLINTIKLYVERAEKKAGGDDGH